MGHTKGFSKSCCGLDPEALCITFYGHSNVSDGENYQINDHLIGLIFTLCAQHGDVPIIFSGDFQADPDIYCTNRLLMLRVVVGGMTL